jgi:hypothetical protein
MGPAFKKCKTGPVRKRVLAGERGWREKVKEGEYGVCTLYTCMKIEY